MKITGLNQSPLITPQVSDLIGFWHAGFAAHRATMMYAVETGINESDFLRVASAQVPLLNLITAELTLFTRIEWRALMHLPPRPPLDATQKKALCIFRHDVAAREGMLDAVVQLSAVDPDHLSSWYTSAQHEYRLRPALGHMIRGICVGALPHAIERGVSLQAHVESTLHFFERCYDPAKAIFRNVIDNSIKYCKRGNAISVRNEGLTVTFEDDGPGMHPNFAARLGRGERLRERRIAGVDGDGIGWESIGHTARTLGWHWHIDTEIGHGTKVVFTINKDNFYPSGRAITGINRQFNRATIVPVAHLIESARNYTNVEPFQGYRADTEGNIRIVDSPIYSAIEYAQTLIEKL